MLEDIPPAILTLRCCMLLLEEAKNLFVELLFQLEVILYIAHTS